jgi:hypothetical protein
VQGYTTKACRFIRLIAKNLAGHFIGCALQNQDNTALTNPYAQKKIKSKGGFPDVVFLRKWDGTYTRLV